MTTKPPLAEDQKSQVQSSPAGGPTPVDEVTQFVQQLSQFFDASTLLQLDWKDPSTVELRNHRAGPTGGVDQSTTIHPTAAQLPLPDDGVDTILNLGSIANIDERALPAWLAELRRVTRRNAWIAVRAAAGRDRRWWEARFFAAGFRKHPKLMEVVPYERLEAEGETLLLLFETVPSAALAKFPLETLKAERDLHMDMTRESGRRSDAHIARYVLARRYLPTNGLVLDAACGLGYGSAILACDNPAVQVIGIDNSKFAVAHGEATFQPTYPNISFRVGDVCDLSGFADGSVGLVVSFETVEHLREPEKFLAEVRRVLKPDGTFICSVPNRWVDEQGKDPNPWHFHVFDFTKIVDLCGQHLSVQDVYNQTAGGGMKLTHAPRRIRQVSPDSKPDNDQAEWWLVAATRSPATTVSAPTPKPTGTILVLTYDNRHPLFTSWLDRCSHPVVYATNTPIDFEFPADTGLVVGADCYNEPRASLLSRAMERGIPTLLLADGILEYRNIFEHPQIPPAAHFQPVRAHKIACLGRSQARVLETWGNAGQVEITGSPRFDRYATLKRRGRTTGEPFRVLVSTALTPYFTPEQHERVRQSLLDLKAFFAAHAAVGPTPLEVVWRVTKGLETEIGVDSPVGDLSGRELAEVLQRVDAMISTPSTAMVEAMLLGLPVAVLDYTNSPHYVAPAWRITAKEQIKPTVAELIDPPAPKMRFQDMTLHDTLECATPAAPRLLRLADEMLAHGQAARANGASLALPPRLIPCHADGPALTQKSSDPAKLHPEQPQFRDRDLQALQVEVSQLRSHAADLTRTYERASTQAAEQAKRTIQWRSKFEAGVAVAAAKIPHVAIRLMLEALKVADASKDPVTILDALTEIAPALQPLDANRARTLFEVTITLAERLKRPEAATLARDRLAATDSRSRAA